MPNDDKFPVAEPSDQWRIQAPVWNLVDTLWIGTRAMRDAGKEFLPQQPAEVEAAYLNRLMQSVLTPSYPDIIKKLMGKILKQPVILEEDVPASVIRYMDDVDAEGTDINEWTKKIGQASLNHGVTFMLVDSPNVDRVNEEREAAGEAPMSRADLIKGTMRPYVIHVLAPQILGWKSDIIDGQVMLTQIRILFVSMEDSPEDEFTQVEVSRIHVWEIGRKRIYRKQINEDGSIEWVLESDDPVDMDFIPLIGVYSNQQKFMVGTPPLIDVAYLNVAHWQSDSDQRNILHVVRVPIMFGAGLGDIERGDFQLQVGPNTMTRGPMGSTLAFVEHTGAGIEAGARDLEVLEARMAKLGLNMIVRNNSSSGGMGGGETATARVLDQSEADSPLGLFARELEAGLEKMLDLFAFILGLGEDMGGSVTLFKDFSISQRDSDDVKALADMRTRGDISQLTYWDELKRRGLLGDDFDPETEIDLLDVEFQDSMPGVTGEEANNANQVGDETDIADGHTHVLQANGFTNIVAGHRHSWGPADEVTSTDDGHEHRLKGAIEDGERNGSEGEQEKGAPPAGSSNDNNQQSDSGGE